LNSDIDSTKGAATAAIDWKTHDLTNSAGVASTTNESNLNGAVETTHKEAAEESSTGSVANDTVPRVITDAEARIVAKTIQMPLVPGGMNAAPREQATVAAGSIAIDNAAMDIGATVPITGLPLTNLQRAVVRPGANSRPGAFGIPGPDAGQAAVDDASLVDNAIAPTPTTPMATPLENTGLAVAAPIHDTGDLEDAHPALHEDEEAKLLEKKKETLFWIAIGALALIALVIFVVIFVVVQNEIDASTANGATAEATIAPNDTSAPTEPPEVLKMKTLLSEYYFSKVQNQYSPQGMAFDWLIQDPNFGSYSDKRLRQRYVLATFYYSTHGEEWGPTWLDRTKHECQWECYMPKGEDNDNLNARYSELKHIDGPCVVPVNSSELHNSPEITATSTLEHDDYLYLAFVQKPLTGSLPQEITMLTNLKMLQLDNTLLEGATPTILAEFPGLIALQLDKTLMTGTIPTELAKLTELRTLVIGGNKEITGYLPTEIGLLSNLETLKIMETNVTGPIPPKYLALDFYELDLNSNLLNGTLPTEFGLLTRLDWLSLHLNSLVSISGLACSVGIAAGLK
jgi:Leucine-rich repeat (LRR) protein